ncbi:hypothetical protein [Picosynechococcus sp. PCC 73109]|uniref:hypothetical protein n=1 Tax=Picosynechococcus sp. PCC 73109 TaxID=374982 RepID=UPI000AD5F795|nr:hypothetical protein [Picosynechococcus sp. PCC 73109]
MGLFGGLMGAIWLRGQSRSGKTTALVARLKAWVAGQDPQAVLVPGLLVLAANNQNQRLLADLIHQEIRGSYPFVSKTPVAFMADEVELFFPLICEQLAIAPPFPLRLRPEMEQKLARELWADTLATWELLPNERFQNRLVRRLLDILLLAGAAGIALEEIPQRLIAGQLSLLTGTVAIGAETNREEFTETAGKLIQQWRDWCLGRGFLTYGIIYNLYGQYLLENEQYQASLGQRFGAIFADDGQDYPAIAKDLADILLNQGCTGVFTENPAGRIRLGLSGDPDYWGQLAQRCEVIHLERPSGLGATLTAQIRKTVTQPQFGGQLPATIQSIQTVARAQLLTRVSEQIQFLVKDQGVAPADIAIIAPGLDEVARYTLIESLAAEIPLEPLREQRPIASSPWGRSLLTLLALIYPGSGRLIQSQAVAEMLMMLSQTASEKPLIDPVRAGLLVDYCFQPDPERPQLLPATTMPRGDRLGYQTTQAYEAIRQWIEQTQATHQITPQGILQTLNQAIQTFYLQKLAPSYGQLATLRELSETAQHFWQCGDRLDRPDTTAAQLADLLQLIQAETITANPLPQYNFNHQPPNSITLATIFQYRSARRHHSYQFWLDAGSRLWEKGGAATLFGYGVFQRSWQGEPWSLALEQQGDRQRLQDIIQDLLARTDTQIYLCHSDFGTNGSEQLGPLYPLIQATQECLQSSLEGGGR